MREHRDVALVLEREVERRRGAEAVARRADARHALLLERRDDVIDDRDPRLGRVLDEPGRAVEGGVLERLVRERVADHDVGDDGLEAILCEAVREELW